MNTYAHRFMLAAALKQAPPLVRGETGEASDAPSPVPPPPEFSAAELAPAIREHQLAMAAWSAFGGFVAGAVIVGFLWQDLRGH